MREETGQLAHESNWRAPGAITAWAGLVAVAVAMGIGRFAFTPILPMMQDDASVSVVSGGWLASANYLGYLLGALAAVGMKTTPAATIRWGLIAIGAVTFGMGWQNHFAIWLLLRLVAGVVNAWVVIFAFAWCLEQLEPLRQPLLNSFVFAGVGAGITVVGSLCIVLMQAQVSSAMAWMVFGTISIVAAVAIWPAFESTSGTPTAIANNLYAARHDWNADWIRLVLCFSAAGFGYIIPATFLPVMAKQFIRDPLVFGWSWPIFGVAALVSTLLGSLLVRSIGIRRLWVSSCLVMAFGVVLPVFWPGIGATMIAAVCVGGTFMVITMSSMQEARNVAGPRSRKLMAAMTSGFALGQIAGPISVSWLVGEDGNFSLALLTAGALLLLSAYALSRRPSDVTHAETG